jgi:hypothetical protein
MLIKGGIPSDFIKPINSLKELEQNRSDAAIFAVGNIGGFGRELAKYMEEAGDVLGR